MTPIKVSGYIEPRVPLVQSAGKDAGKVFCHLPKIANRILNTIAEGKAERQKNPDHKKTRYELQGWRVFTETELAFWENGRTEVKEGVYEYPDRINIVTIDANAKALLMREQDEAKLAEAQVIKEQNAALAQQNEMLMKRLAALEANASTAPAKETTEPKNGFTLSLDRLNNTKDVRTLKNWAARLDIPGEDYMSLKKGELIELLTPLAV